MAATATDQRPVIDGFAGPGGWDVAAHALGLEPLGIEWDDAACATREAAGLRTLQADIAELDPVEVLSQFFGALATLWGLIMSPPCQAFSMAGKGAGRRAIQALVAAIEAMARGEEVDRAALDAACDDERAHLVLEPLRWALALKPRWIACEQVEPVLPLWEAIAAALRQRGYQTWVGVLSAEQYGVPQTRKRAILLASLDGPVSRPAPTHQRYIAPRRNERQVESLFEAPEPERVVAPEDRGLLPWVSMAEALGRAEGPSPSPSPTVTSGGGRTGGVEVFASKDSRERVAGAVVMRQQWARPNEAVRRADEPAPTLTGGGGAGRERVWVVETNNYNAHPGCPGGAGGHPRWTSERPSTTVTGTQRSEEGGTLRAPSRERPERQPEWVGERPATTVAGDPRIAEPGWRGAPSDYDADGNYIGKRSMDNAVRVSIEEAAVLQSFPPDYPFMAGGTKTKAFEGVGNAVPPLLAFHCLRAVMTESGIAPRFWPKVQIRTFGECWEWRAAMNEHGYGVMRPEGQRTGATVKAHRVAWEIAHGPIPDGACVLHACDNPPCCNPFHLFLGTQADNLADMRAKGRGNTGSVNGQAKLNEDAVRSIRIRLAAGETQKALCNEYGVSAGTMSALANGKTWSHVA